MEHAIILEELRKVNHPEISDFIVAFLTKVPESVKNDMVAFIQSCKKNEKEE